MKNFSNETNGSRKKIKIKLILKYFSYIIRIIIFLFVLDILGSLFIDLIGLISPDLIPTSKSFPIALNLITNVLYGIVAFIVLSIIGIIGITICSQIKDEICEFKKTKPFSKIQKHNNKDNKKN